MGHRKVVASAASVAMCMMAAVGVPASAAPQPHQVSTVAGLQSRAVPGAQDTGVASGTKTVSLVLASQDKAGLAAFVAGPHAPLSAQEFAQRFGPSPQAIQRVSNWATAAGLSVRHEANSQLVQVTGTTQQISSAFSTSMHGYSVGGHRFVAAAGAGSLPADVAAVTAGVIGVSAPTTLQLANAGKHRKQGRQTGPAASTSFGPAQLTQFYQAPSSVTGQGQAVSIIGEGDLTQVGQDLVTFENQFGLPHVPLNVIKVDGGSSDTSGQDEWDLDTQYSSGFAPDISGINFYAGPDLSDQSLLDATAQWVTDDKTRQGSASLGECETDAQASGFLAAEDAILQQAVAQGQTLFVSSGDTGSKCGTTNGVVSGPKGVSYPASSPFVVGVGGTTITDFNSHSEVAWHPSGGGMSTIEAAPSFQANAGGAFQAGPRGVPDVALDADPNSGYQVVISGQLAIIGGTSAGAPSWNGIWARAEQQNGGQLGFAAPLLYNLPASAFNDITSGNNGDFTAGPGWDYVTGRGSPNIGAVVSQVGG